MEKIKNKVKRGLNWFKTTKCGVLSGNSFLVWKTGWGTIKSSVSGADGFKEFCQNKKMAGEWK